jgi:hypothetical protein
MKYPFRASRARARGTVAIATAGDINGALERLAVIKTVRVGDARPGGKASEFRYLLPQTENVAEDDGDGFDL